MRTARRSTLIALLSFWIAPCASARAAADASVAPPLAGATAWPRTVFVIGAPGRLDSAGDQRRPRLSAGAESAAAAYADVEVVQDPTWLRHEIEHYARRSIDCAGLSAPWCGRAAVRRGAARVIALTAGAHAELLWLSGRDTAVRLGWQRLVQTPTGTMTLDDPPAAFAAALLAQFPGRRDVFELDAAHEARWRAEEVDRLLYYAEQVIAGLPAVAVEAHRRRAAQFVEQSLAELDRLGVPTADAAEATAVESLALSALDQAKSAGHGVELAALRAWRAQRALLPWCAAEPASSAAGSP